MIELYIPSEETVKEFDWPFQFRDSGADSDFSKYPLQSVSKDDTLKAGIKALSALEGPFLISAVESVHTLLSIQDFEEREE